MDRWLIKNNKALLGCTENNTDVAITEAEAPTVDPKINILANKNLKSVEIVDTPLDLNDLDARTLTSKNEINASCPANKLPRLSKGTKNTQLVRNNKFCQSWLNVIDFKNWLTKSSTLRNGHEFAFCQLCHCDITAHKNDIKRHSSSEKHIFNSCQISLNQKVCDMAFVTANDPVKRAEIKLCAFLASNNLMMMDTLAPLCANLFPDSKIASRIAVRRTKATTVMQKCLGEVFQNKQINILREPGKFFSLIMDETTDTSTKKQCAFTVIYFCTENNKVVTKFFDMRETIGASAEDLYNCLKTVIVEKNIPFTNLVGYSSDTTNVMFGENHSVYTLLKADLPSITCIKCSCHLIHLAASKACLTLPRSVEDMMRNVGAHFSRSPARQGRLMEFQELFKVDIHKILIPANTRWLSLKQCVDRILEQYEPLVAYFRVETLSDHSRTTEDILKVLNINLRKYI